MGFCVFLLFSHDTQNEFQATSVFFSYWKTISLFVALQYFIPEMPRARDTSYKAGKSKAEIKALLPLYEGLLTL